MFGTIVSLLLLIVGFCMHRLRGTWSSPDVLFCYQWALISFLASLHLYQMFEVGSFTWFVILIGSLSFVVGAHIAIPKNISKRQIYKKAMFFFDKSTFWFLFVVLFIFMWRDFWIGFQYQQMGYTLAELRNASFGGDAVNGLKRGSGALFEIFNTLKSAATLLVIAVGVHYYTVGEKRRNLYIIASATLVLLEAYTDGGRFGLAYLIVEVFVCYHFFKSDKSNKKNSIVYNKSSISLYLVILLLGTAIMSVSFARGWDSEILGIKYYRYLCGNIPFLDQHLKTLPEDTPIYVIWNSLHGVWALILPILSGLLGMPNPEIYRQSQTEIIGPLGEMIPIGVDMQTNAFITPFYHLYVDGRIFGVVIGMALFGYLAGKVFTKAKETNSGRNVVFYLIISQMIFKSLQLYPFVSTGYVFIALFFYIYRKNTFNIFSSLHLKP